MVKARLTTIAQRMFDKNYNRHFFHIYVYHFCVLLVCIRPDEGPLQHTGTPTMSIIPGPVTSRSRHRRARPLVIAMTASVAVHAALGAYLALQKFTLPDALRLEDPILVGELFDPPRPRTPPPPRPAEPRPPEEPAPSSRPDQHRTPLDMTEGVESVPVSEASQPQSEQGPVHLTAEPSEAASGPTERSAVILKPDWVRKPTADQVSRAYPDRALRRGVSGEVMLTCEVTASGAVRSCAVLVETPEDYGFGAAALRLSRYFQLRPLMEDGRPTGKGVVSIPVRFNLG